MARPTKQSQSFDIKLGFVQRFVAGETPADLAAEADISIEVLQSWVGAYRRAGTAALGNADALRDSPWKFEVPSPALLSELERLRRENEQLRAEVEYLGQLRALRTQEQL
ncbi:hypothetical protein [Arthrobacter sp. fls2-241-R2A-200]|uniref:hypothetical protein n=1 Tax=Arthrobacter sp. fls2-241-R2A-200 TaxID=3040281 RepID=UPI00254DFABB|nr:hypothetical protein [Arthrobacter sp. fls2-241-R2A-200]